MPQQLSVVSFLLEYSCRKAGFATGTEEQNVIIIPIPKNYIIAYFTLAKSRKFPLTYFFNVHIETVQSFCF